MVIIYVEEKVATVVRSLEKECVPLRHQASPSPKHSAGGVP